MVRTQNHTMIYDTGLPWTRIADFLQAEEVSQLDLLMVSHEDSDHSGGVEKLIAIYPPKTMLREQCKKGQSWQWDDVNFTVIHPHQSLNTRNDDSCVLLIDNGQYRTLLPGDIEAKAEQSILAHYPDLKVDLLIAPHHGSNTSSTMNFLTATYPRYVVFATGYRNRYRFPNKKVLARYEKLDTVMYNTAIQGAIMFRFPQDDVSLSVTALREQYQRVWQTH